LSRAVTDWTLISPSTTGTPPPTPEGQVGQLIFPWSLSRSVVVLDAEGEALAKGILGAAANGPAVGPVARAGTHRSSVVEQGELDIGARPAALDVSEPLILRIADAAGSGQPIDLGAVCIGRREEGTLAAFIDIGSRQGTFDADDPRPGLIIKSGRPPPKMPLESISKLVPTSAGPIVSNQLWLS
jgi:hypothetical protein